MSFLETRIPNYTRIYRRTLGRFLGWLFSWRIMRRILLTVVVVVTLAATYLTEERWRGERAWNAYKQLHHQDEADYPSGKRLPVPDDQNFAMTPLLKPIYTQGEAYFDQLEKRTSFSSHGDVIDELNTSNAEIQKPAYFKAWQKYLGTDDFLQALKQVDPALDELAAASRRPYSQFPTHQEYPEFFFDLNWAMGDLARLYEFRAVAELDQKQNAQAAEDVVTQFRLGRAIAHWPMLTAELIGEAMAYKGTDVLHLGLNTHQWSEAQLQTFQVDLQKLDIVTSLQSSLQKQQAGWTAYMEDMMKNPAQDTDDLWSKESREMVRMFPRGWVYQNMIIYNNYFDRLRAAFDPVHHRVDEAALDSLSEYKRTIQHHWWSPYTYFATFSMTDLTALVKNSFESIEPQLDFATAACAIERYRLAHGSLPDTLQELVPQYLAKVPEEVFHGTPLKYRHEGNDQYTLSYMDPDAKGTTVFGAPVATLIWKYPFN